MPDWKSDKIELAYPDRLVFPSSWVGHIPFAFWLVAALKPHNFIELGVHSGNSYCAFLQAIQTIGLDTHCFGIDHWRGDEQAGAYDQDVYHDLCAYHDPKYGTFSTLIRSSFDDALPNYADAEIDLLHIDGFHTYEAVAHDFSTWLPKMSSRGVVLLHDTIVRANDFGVWRLWKEVAGRFPSFEFQHSHGLGVAYVGTEPLSSSLQSLFSSQSGRKSTFARNYFARLGTSILERYEWRAARRDNANLTHRIEKLDREFEAHERELLGRTEQAETHAVALAKEIAERDAEIVNLAERLKDADDQATAFAGEVRDRTAELAARDAEGVKLAESLARADDQLAARDAESVKLAESLGQAEDQLAALAREVKDRAADIADKGEQLKLIDTIIEASVQFGQDIAAQPLQSSARQVRSEPLLGEPLRVVEPGGPGLAAKRGRGLTWKLARATQAAHTATFLPLAARIAERRLVRELYASGAFDPGWYRERYRDVAASGTDPVLHYIRFGAAEQRDPSATFSTSAYLARHSDGHIHPNILVDAVRRGRLNDGLPINGVAPAISNDLQVPFLRHDAFPQITIVLDGRGDRADFEALIRMLSTQCAELPIETFALLPPGDPLLLAGAQRLTAGESPQASWNKALTLAKAPVAVFVGQNILLARGAIAELCMALTQDEETVLVTGALTGRDGSPRESGLVLSEKGVTRWCEAGATSRHFPLSSTAEIDGALPGLFAGKVKPLRLVGGFEISLPAELSVLDIALRLKRNGGRVLRSAAACASVAMADPVIEPKGLARVLLRNAGVVAGNGAAGETRSAIRRSRYAEARSKLRAVIELASFDKGGLEKVVLDSAVAFDRSRILPVIVTVGPVGHLGRVAERMGVEVVKLPATDTEQAYGRFLEDFDPHVAISHFSSLGYPLFRSRAIPNITFIHNVYAFMNEQYRSRFVHDDAFVELYVAVSRKAARYASANLGIREDKIVTIPNGLIIPEHEARERNRGTLTRKQFGLTKDDYVFLNPASYNLHKGHYVMTAALAEILKTRSDIKILCVGNEIYPPHVQELRNHIKNLGLGNHMLMPGYFPNIEGVMGIADACLLPSFIEGWSIAMNEAMFYRKPLILTDTGGASDVIENNDIGILLPTEYPALETLNHTTLDELAYMPRQYRIAGPLAKAMVEFADNRERWARAGELGRRKIYQRYDFASVVVQYETLMRQVAERALVSA